MTRRNATYYGKQGAGILLISQGRVFLALRSAEVNEPLTWAVPGGKVESNETPYEAAVRETREEFGSIPAHVVVDEGVFVDGSFRYTTFFALVQPDIADAWEPELNWENDDAQWFSVDALPGDLHFGLRHLLQARPELLSSWATR